VSKELDEKKTNKSEENKAQA
jgi:hypothetical protein